MEGEQGDLSSVPATVSTFFGKSVSCEAAGGRGFVAILRSHRPTHAPPSFSRLSFASAACATPALPGSPFSLIPGGSKGKRMLRFITHLGA